MNKRKQLWSLLVLLFFALNLTTACSTLDKEASANSNGVLTVTGTVEAKEVDVSSKIPGKIVEIPVTEGMEVKKGDLLFAVDDKDLAVKKLQAEAAVKAAEAQLDKAIKGARKQQIAQAKAALAQAEAQVDLLQTKYDRYSSLYEAGALTEDQFDEVKTKLEVAVLQKETAQEQYDLVLEGAQAEDIKALEAQYEAAKAQLEEVKINLAETKVTAPTKGNISLIIAEEGEIVASGMAVITITDYSDAWVEANVAESQMGKVKVGQKAEIVSKAYPDYIFNGEVISVNKNPDFAISKSTNELNEQDVISYALKIKIVNPEKQLYPGMLVDVALVGNEG